MRKENGSEYARRQRGHRAETLPLLLHYVQGQSPPLDAAAPEARRPENGGHLVGGIAPGACMVSANGQVSIADVARAAGVSRTTVSHALNGLGRIDPRTRERVKTVAAELGYRPNLRAQRLRTGTARTIGLVSSMPSAVAGGPSRLGFYMELAAAAAETALNRGYALVLVPPVESPQALDSLDIDGAIVVEPDRDDPATERLRQRGLGVVSVSPQPGADLPSVDLDSEQVAQLLLEHLYDQGARRIALIVGDSHRQAHLDVRASYDHFVGEHGLLHLVAHAAETGGEQAGFTSMKELLAAHPDLDAVYAAVDVFAVGAVRALREAGKSIPGDVMVVTRYDGVRAQTCDPPLTAVNLHLAEVADQAVNLLLAQLDGAATDPQPAVPEPELVRRLSSHRASDDHPAPNNHQTSHR